MPKKHKPHKIHWHKETLLVILALFSVGMFAYEYAAHPSETVVNVIAAIDAVIACVFLLDFWYLYKRSRQKHYFIRHNWYLLLSAMPVISVWFAPLRALRLLRFVRLIVAGEHLEQSVLQSKHKL